MYCLCSKWGAIPLILSSEDTCGTCSCNFVDREFMNLTNL